MTKAVAIKNAITNMPAHLKGTGPIGNENVGADDLTIPRIGLLQDLSPEVKKSNPKYIKNAEAGMLVNLLTKELFNDVNLIPIFVTKEFPVFVKRDKGGGYKGNYSTKAEAEAFVASQTNSADLDIVETANHFCLRVDDKGVPVEQVMFPMSSTKLGFSRSWNSIIMKQHEVRFACSWNIGTIVQKNTKGEFYNLAVLDQGSWVSKEVFDECQAIYENLAATIGSKDAS